MRRREFITLIGGAVALPLTARAQQGERVRRIGVLMGEPEGDAEAKVRLTAFLQELRRLGWVVDRNVQVVIHWAGANAADIRRHAAELAAINPDVIVTGGSTTLGPLLQTTRTVPIVFPFAADPVGAGFVNSLARPGGNATGFIQFEYSLSAKWLELLKEVAPRTNRAAILRDPALAAGIGQFGAIQSVAPSLGIEVSPISVRDPTEIESAVTEFARSGNGGLILTGSAQSQSHRHLIISLAARHKIPAVYFHRSHVVDGALISYGVDVADQYRRAAGYVDRILKGEKPADLPVQAPTKYELVINLKTAKALGLTLPASVLARADEVIE